MNCNTFFQWPIYNLCATTTTTTTTTTIDDDDFCFQLTMPIMSNVLMNI